MATALKHGVPLKQHEAKVDGFNEEKATEPVIMTGRWGAITVRVGDKSTTVQAKDLLKAVHFLTPT